MASSTVPPSLPRVPPYALFFAIVSEWDFLGPIWRRATPESRKVRINSFNNLLRSEPFPPVVYIVVQ